jgi:tetratricopeptide (TPR) repeat protein
MARRDRRKAKQKKTDHSQRMSRLKAKALTRVAANATAFNARFKSVALLTEALRRDPNNHTILLNLAIAHGRTRNYQAAEKLLARVLELAPRSANVCHGVASAYLQIERPERALECYRRTLELSQDASQTIATLLDLARVYERRHQVDEALEVIRDALQRDPGNEQARLQHALLDRRRGETALAEAELRSLARDVSRTRNTRIEAGYELAKLLDNHEQYDQAFQALVATKQLLQHCAPRLLKQNRAAILKTRELLSMMDEPCIERWKNAAQSDSPYRFAMLSGHPRTGTTLIEQVLDTHDEVISADELDVFTEWVYLPIVRKFPITASLRFILDRVPPGVRKQARATYWHRTEAIFDEPIGSRMLLDKNPGIMTLMPIINWAFPEVKMLIALRDPRDIILSCFMLKVPVTPISVNWLSLEDAAHYYANIMKTWLALRERTRSPWLEFRYEDAVADLEREARKILEFLGLPWDDKVLKFYEHAREKIVRSPTYRDVTQPVYQKSIGRWQNYAQHLEPILTTLEPFVKEFGYAP